MSYNTKYYNRRTKNLFKSRKKNRQGKRKKGKISKGRRKRKSASRKSRRSRIKKKIMIGGRENNPNNIPTGSKVKFIDTTTNLVVEGWIMQRMPQQNDDVIYYISTHQNNQLLNVYQVNPSDIIELIYKHNEGRLETINVQPPGNDYYINRPTEENWWDWWEDNPEEERIWPWQLY